ncbi:MAG: sulfatase-like hydrolase/transferase [Candidatus Latescibacterota bacterium]|nr:sulfatase-like hydrolase/transferase [Candidatus Latescibacterota bacterium]
MVTPNIIFITTDHLRYDTLGCTGDPVIQTPAIDRLAATSTRMSRFFVQNPVCAPSRASFMTGRYTCNHGVRWNGSRLNENEITLVEHLKQNGYKTACVGKHHIGQRRFQDNLDHADAQGIRRGWRERPDGDYTVTDPNLFEQYVRARGYEYKTGYALPGFREKLGAVPSDLPEDCHIDAYVGMKSLEYLDQIIDDDPFFLWVGFYGPHHPYVPSGRFAEMYDPNSIPGFQKADDDIVRKPVEYGLYFEAKDHKFHGFADAEESTFREMKAAYYGMVSQIDWQVGLILDRLQEIGLDQNTVVVFLSDHGEFLGDHGIPAKAPFLLDSMLHVPCFIHVPDKEGQDCEALTESIDLYPTLCGLAGIEPPDCVQGRDMAPLLEGESKFRDVVFAEAVDKRCIRTDRWKYIHYPGSPRGELYDVLADPHELSNLWDDVVETRNELRDRYYVHLDTTDDFRHPSYQRYTGTDPATGESVTHYLTW